MKNSYKVVVKSNQGNAKTTTHDVPEPGSWWGALKIKAVPGARYQLIDNTTGQGPDNIRVKRVGNDLRISFDGREDADLVISDYYEYTAPGFGAVIGETDPGVYYAYTPESGQTAALMGNLPDGASHIGMALGGEQVVASGAAVGALVAVAGFNPLLAAPLALLGAGGGGGGGPASATPNPNTTATIDIVAITDDSGVSGSDFITNDKSLTYSGTVSNFTANGDKVKVELLAANGTTVLETAYVDVTGASSTKAGAGSWSWTRSDKHTDGQYTLRATVVDTSGNRTNATAPTNGTGGGQDTQVVIVDTDGGTNQPDGSTNPNTKATVDIVAITEDRGVSAIDFITNDKSLTYSGTVSNFTANGDKVKLELLASDGITVLETTYVDVTSASTTAGAGSWNWTRPTEHTDGQYSLRATIVDTSGNRTNATGGGQDTQILKINTGSGVDPNKLQIGITSFGEGQDSGNLNNNDFLTNVQKLSFKGSFLNEGAVFNAGAKILVQVIDTSGKILSMSYQDLNSNGQWVFNNELNTLGVDGFNTQYLLKASIVDLAGNILKTTDQSFVVDLDKPDFSQSDGFKFFADERGLFSLNGKVQNAIGRLDLDRQTYQPGEFNLTFVDLAGNLSPTKAVNSTVWDVNSGVTTGYNTNSGPSTFSGNEVVGSIGKYVLAADVPVYDLAALHADIPKVDDLSVHNHIGLSGSGIIQDVAHTLKLTMGDVLALGVKNSFSTNNSSTSDGRIQMRIDGGSDDTVNLDNIIGDRNYDWTAQSDVTISGNTYDAYVNADLNLEVFIQKQINLYLV